jgi:hypothetical protein
VRIRPGELAEIKAGTIDLGFRRWDRPRLVVGTRMRTPVGLIEDTAVEPVDESTITEDDARRAGAPIEGNRVPFGGAGRLRGGPPSSTTAWPRGESR